MLEGYAIKTTDDRDRLIAVQAALELAKVALGSDSNSTASKIKSVSVEISGLADAIQAALKK